MSTFVKKKEKVAFDYEKAYKQLVKDISAERTIVKTFLEEGDSDMNDEDRQHAIGYIACLNRLTTRIEVCKKKYTN